MSEGTAWIFAFEGLVRMKASAAASLRLFRLRESLSRCANGRDPRAKNALVKILFRRSSRAGDHRGHRSSAHAVVRAVNLPG